MADNLGYTQGSGSTVATEEVTTLNGVAVATQHAQRIAPVIVTANSTAVDITGDQTNGIDVDVTRVSGNVTVVQATGSNLNAAVTGTVTANAGTGSFTVAQATAANLNATVTGTVTANAGTGNFTVTQATAANLNATVTGSVGVSSLPALASGTNYVGRVRITDGTNDYSLDTLYNDAESATENHLNVGSRLHALNSAGTFDLVRANTTTFKAAQYTTAQTGANLWVTTAGKAVCITAMHIQCGGTTAGTMQVFFAPSATTTFTRGTTPAIFDGEFAPNQAQKPGVYVNFSTPCRGALNDYLHVTTSAAMTVTITVWGYEI